MATPTFIGLPTELLCQIIPHVLPEGFESLALTCRTIYQLCTPFIERHNYLNSYFRKCNYRPVCNDWSMPPITTAFELISRIAAEPIVGRYIRHADFTHDTWPPRVRRPPHVPDVHDGGPIVALFADCPYLRHAGLDWKEYYASMEEELSKSPTYSQCATVFILTLLPNVETIRLPGRWSPVDKAKKLLDAIVRRTRQSNLPWDRPSLAQVTRFESSKISESNPEVAFLALPRIRWFRGGGDTALGHGSITLVSKDPYLYPSGTLEFAHLVNCHYDDIAITKFLEYAPRLRTLVYSHMARRDGPHQDWDICKFTTAIERVAGDTLEELSISITARYGSAPPLVLPGKASMRGFRCLRKLQFPLEIAMCNIADAVSRVHTPDQTLDELEPILGDLLPSSVSQLSLISSGKDHHENALKVMFRHFATEKDSQWPALKEIRLCCPESPSADDAYKEECAKLVAETEEAGVELCLERIDLWSYFIDSDSYFKQIRKRLLGRHLLSGGLVGQVR